MSYATLWARNLDARDDGVSDTFTVWAKRLSCVWHACAHHERALRLPSGRHATSLPFPQIVRSLRMRPEYCLRTALRTAAYDAMMADSHVILLLCSTFCFGMAHSHECKKPPFFPVRHERGAKSIVPTLIAFWMGRETANAMR